MPRDDGDRDPHRYPPIADYAFIADCHSSALVSRTGSIDWCCMPRFDSATVFGRILDWERGGYWSMEAVGDTQVSREYIDDTLVLATTFQHAQGEARVIDCFTMVAGGARQPYRQLLRVVEGVRGKAEFVSRIVPRFDYGGVRPWLRHHGERFYSAVGGNDSLVISGDADLQPVDHHELEARFEVRPGARVRLSVVWMPPEEIDPVPGDPPGPDAIDSRLDRTLEWWRSWSKGIAGKGSDDPGARRSAVVLKALTNAPTGAVAAAATTSLPEAIPGNRNWDYRYSWIRDSQFTVRSLGQLGAIKEADGFRRFIERSAAGSSESLQIMYGLGGERRLTEIELDLDGYRGCKPVRIGNLAAGQLQLDMYGELMDLAWSWHQRGRSPDDDYWRFLLSLVDTACDKWSSPDRGLWEVRGDPRHFVHSKVMCWVAVDRGLRLADECLRAAPTKRWAKVRDEIREAVETEGIDDDRGVFVQSFGSKEMDAALLLLPTVDFVAYDDERMLRTADAVRTDLDDGGLIRRYRGEDALDGDEGTFIACSFWLAECYAHQNRLVEAQRVFDRAVATANDLGLFAEEYDAGAHEQRGNFPQGLTHLSHIAAVVALANAADRVGTTAHPH